MKNRTVLFLYYSSHPVCGIGTWLEVLASELERTGWNVVTGLAWGRKYHDPRKIEECRPNLKTIRMDGRTGTEEGRVQAIAGTIRKVRPEVVILNCLNSGFEAVRRLRRQGVKMRLIAANHGNLAQHAACMIYNRDVIDLVACIGRQSVEVLTAPPEGFASDRVWHLPNAVAVPDRSFCASSPTNRVGYAGRLSDEPVKRAGDLIHFAEQIVTSHTGSELWIAGAGDLEDEIVSLAKQFPDRIKYFGMLSRRELYAHFYPGIDMLVSFSSSEGFGLSMAEAMAHGVVPVSSNFLGRVTEGLVRDDENAVVFPVGNVVRAREAVVELWENPARLNALGACAADHIRQCFSPERSGKHWNEALAHCLSLPELCGSENVERIVKQDSVWINEWCREIARRLLRRRVHHASSGEEWPGYHCKDTELERRVAQAMEFSEPSGVSAG